MSALRLAVVLLLGLGAAASPAAAGLPPEAARLEARLKGLQGLLADFEQIRNVLLTGEEIHAHGILAFRPPHAFRLAFRDPEPQELVIRGDSLWVYTPSENQAQRFPYQADSPGNEVFALFGSGQSLDTVYEVVQERWLTYPKALRLIPRNRDPGYPLEEIRLVVGGDGYPERLFFREVTGDTVVLRFTSFRRNPPDLETYLALRIPPGTEIIEAMELGTELPMPGDTKP